MSIDTVIGCGYDINVYHLFLLVAEIYNFCSGFLLEG